MDTAQSGYDESKALIERWRGRGRLDYAITPRFAVTSSEAQLEAAGALAREFPDAYVQTHLDENKAEIELVAERFPEGARAISTSMLAPGCSGRDRCSAIASILAEDEVAAMAASRSVAAFCPTSNLFLGSGLFDQARLDRGRRAGRARDRRRRRHELLDAAHRRGGVQGAAAQPAILAGRAGLLSHDARQRPRAQSRRPDRRDRDREGSRPRRARTRGRPRRWRIAWRRRRATSTRNSSR